MANDDYFVLAYKLLGYLYKCLKEGIRPEWDYMRPHTRDFPVAERYFLYVLENLTKDGHITGRVPVQSAGGAVRFKETTGIRITPKGIAYLEENSMMRRASEFLGPAAEIFSGVAQLT